MHTRALFLLLLFLPMPRLCAQSQLVDSLVARLDSTVVSTEQVILHLELAEAISNADIRLALEHAGRAMHMAEVLDSERLEAEAKLAIGDFYDYLGVRSEAIVLLNDAWETFKRLGMSREEIRTQMLLGNAHFYLQKYESALKYYRRAQAAALSLKDTTLIIASMNAIGAGLGNTPRKDSALILFQEANALARQVGNMDQVILTYFNMGDVNLYSGRIDDALGIFHDLEEYYDLEEHSSKHLTSLYNSMTLAFIRKGDLKWARRYSEKTRLALKSYTRLTESIQFYEQCYQIEAMDGNPQRALEHYRTYTQLKDSLSNGDFKERLINLEIVNDVQAKDVEIERLTLDNRLKDLRIKQRNTLSYALVAGFLLLFTIGFLVVRNTMQTRRQNRILQEQKEELERANELIRSQSEDLKEKNSELESVIEELKATQQHLVQSEKMASLGTLTAGIAHEINNPLNFISGGLGIIGECDQAVKGLSEKERKERRAKALAMAQDGLERTNGIVKALMTFSRKGTARKVKSDLHEIIDNTLLFLNSKILGKVKVAKEYTLDRQVTVFPEKMHQVIMNIIDNAIHAVMDLEKGKAEIRICTCEKDGMARMEISNNGPHIPENDLGQLFDPFFTTKEPGQGTGLGLSISYNLVGDHGGHISVQNTEGGVCFIIEIPF